MSRRRPRSGDRDGIVGGLLPMVVALAALLAPGPALAQGHFPAEEDLDVILRYLVEDGATPGVVVAILEADGSTRVQSRGSGGAGTRPLGPRSVFEIGSITKTFTGTLLALAVRRGEVSLEDPVSAYLPDSVRVPTWNGRPITLLDLATHRSGLPGVPDNLLPTDLGDPYAGYTLEVLYDFLADHQLRREPGTEAEYSNLGFGLLGHALARAAGTTFPELLGERILGPLGMDRTGYDLSGETEEWMARPHAAGQVVPRWTGTEAIQGAGGLYSTAEDMLRYLEANVGPPKTELQRAMREAQRARSPFDEEHEIGLGWRTLRVGDRTVVEHGGTTAGTTARIAFDPERQVGLVRLTNTGSFPDDFGLYLLRTGPPLDLPVADVPVETLGRYAGAYEFAPGVRLFVRQGEDGTLTSQLGSTPRFRLYPDSDTTVYLKRLHVRMAFRTGPAGDVESLVLNPGPRQRIMPRVGADTPPPGLPGPPAIRDLPVAPADAARYVGTYEVPRSGRPVEVRIFGVDGALVAEIDGGPPNRLRSQGDHVFVPAEDPLSRATFRVRDDRAVSFTLDLHGTELVAERVEDPGPRP